MAGVWILHLARQLQEMGLGVERHGLALPLEELFEAGVDGG
jgi:hypothetical protein